MYRTYQRQREYRYVNKGAPNPAETNFSSNIEDFELAKKPRLDEIRNLSIAYAVLIHERFDYLKDCLSTLLAADYGELKVNFFLIDDGSEDPRIVDLLTDCASKFPFVRVHFCEKTQSTSGAVTNRALSIMLEHGPYDIYGFGDPDCLYHPSWLQQTLRLKLWLMENYQGHKVGMVSGYNSVSKDFHIWLDEGDSPYGQFVVKRQMGWPSVLVTPEYILSVGLMHENPQDENLYTRRLQELGFANFCLKESLVEHVGQNSLLNNYRSTPVDRADYSFQLKKEGWGPEINTYRNPAIVRDLLNHQIPKHSITPVDVIINLGDKDLPIFPSCVESVRTMLGHPISDIYVITKPNSIKRTLCEDLGVNLIDERELFDIQLPYSHAGIPEIQRDYWIYQQFLKLNCDQIGATKKKLIVDADTTLVSKSAFIDDFDKKTILPVGPYYKHEYYEAYARIFRNEPSNHLSSVCHIMLWDSEHLSAMKQEMESIHSLPWWLCIYSQIDLTKISSFSEFETYSQFVQKEFGEEYKLAHWNVLDVPMKSFTSYEKVLYKYREKYQNIGFQHWIK
jgi:hypothetical protein